MAGRLGLLCLLGLVAAGFRPVYAAALPQGAEIALHGAGRVEACAICHGSQGQGRPHFDYPRLAGLGAPYVLRALRSFADGRRLNGIMTPIARAMSPWDMGAVARYYARFRPQPPVVPDEENPVRLARGRILYEHGDLADKVVACSRCHGSNAHGLGGRFPWLAGQSEAYLKEQLRSFRGGARRGLGLGLMRSAARPLNNRQIGDIALYVSTIGTPSVPVSPKPQAQAVTRYVARPFVPPRRTAVPVGLLGQAVLRGRAIFDDTKRYAPAYVTNALSCSDCHLGEGRQGDAAPLWAAVAQYPQSYNGRVITLAERMRMAFVASENGRPPPLNGPLITDLLAYAHWMSLGERIGTQVAGRGYPALSKPPGVLNVMRGAALYVHSCAVCHGGHGQGTWYAGRRVFPPVWGAASFSHRSSLDHIAVMAAFLSATMPYGKPGSLSPTEAYDLAAFLQAQSRRP